jgi:hypothetical protein
MAGWRNVRVFLSSTFRDMHAEREDLVKTTYPALRERLLPNRVELYDDDLRWGIPEGEAKNEQLIRGVSFRSPPAVRDGGRSRRDGMPRPRVNAWET